MPDDAESRVVEYARGCDLADMLACTSLATAYLAGDGVPADQALGLFILHDACAQGSDSACAAEHVQTTD